MQFYHHWACLFLGKIISCKLRIPEKDLAFATIPSRRQTSIISESLCFISCLIVFQGHTSHTRQLGHTAKMLTGKSKDISGRGLEASLPKGFSCTGPGSRDIHHNGSSNSQFHKIGVFFCVNSVYNLNDVPNSRPPTTATHPCHMLLKPLVRWELPTSARQNCRVIPLSAVGSRQRFVRFWPLHPPTSYSALPPRTSAAIRTGLCKPISDILYFSTETKIAEGPAFYLLFWC